MNKDTAVYQAYFLLPTSELVALEDDRGAKPVCFKHKTQLQIVQTAHEDLDDMDTPEMYQKLKKDLTSNSNHTSVILVIIGIVKRIGIV